MADENNEVKQEEVVEEKKEPQKEEKVPKPKKEKKHGDNTVCSPTFFSFLGFLALSSF